MKEVKVGNKVFKIPQRYTDKRRVELEIKKYKESLLAKPKKKRLKDPNELLIPVMWHSNLLYKVRESKMFKDKWVNHFHGKDNVTAHIAAYKARINYDTKNRN